MRIRECAGCVPELHPGCRFVQCCIERAIEHCGLCEAFPCAHLESFVSDDSPGCPSGYHVHNL
ncbi:MAG TPA: hypothetical protein DCL63_11175 [Firmicutes bacterium]|nr:hypothetical protein [Bacillota bacterium]